MRPRQHAEFSTPVFSHTPARSRRSSIARAIGSFNSRCTLRAPRSLRVVGSCAALLAASIFLTGCLQRTIKVTTQPAGAVVWINDNEVGRTPLETDFTFYGKFSVRIRKEGYEPIVEVKNVKAPLREQPGIDLVAEALPINYNHVVEWHWDLQPVAESRLGNAEAEAAVIHSARQLRTQLQGVDESAKPADMKDKPASVPN